MSLSISLSRFDLDCVSGQLICSQNFVGSIQCYCWLSKIMYVNINKWMSVYACAVYPWPSTIDVIFHGNSSFFSVYVSNGKHTDTLYVVEDSDNQLIPFSSQFGCSMPLLVNLTSKNAHVIMYSKRSIDYRM